MTAAVARMEISEITKLRKGNDYFDGVVEVGEIVRLEGKDRVSRKLLN